MITFGASLLTMERVSDLLSHERSRTEDAGYDQTGCGSGVGPTDLLPPIRTQ